MNRAGKMLAVPYIEDSFSAPFIVLFVTRKPNNDVGTHLCSSVGAPYGPLHLKNPKRPNRPNPKPFS